MGLGLQAFWLMNGEDPVPNYPANRNTGQMFSSDLTCVILAGLTQLPLVQGGT